MKRLTSILFIIMGVILIVFSVMAIKGPKREYATTQGTIVEIEEQIGAGVNVDDTIDTEYHVFINYEVDGVTYENVEYGAYDSRMKVGDQVNVYYDVTDPTFIQAEGFEKVPYVVLAAAIACVVGGSIFFIKSR